MTDGKNELKWIRMYPAENNGEVLRPISGVDDMVLMTNCCEVFISVLEQLPEVFTQAEIPPTPDAEMLREKGYELTGRVAIPFDVDSRIIYWDDDQALGSRFLGFGTKEYVHLLRKIEVGEAPEAGDPLETVIDYLKSKSLEQLAEEIRTTDVQYDPSEPIPEEKDWLRLDVWVNEWGYVFVKVPDEGSAPFHGVLSNTKCHGCEITNEIGRTVETYRFKLIMDAIRRDEDSVKLLWEDGS